MLRYRLVHNAFEKYWASDYLSTNHNGDFYKKNDKYHHCSKFELNRWPVMNVLHFSC